MALFFRQLTKRFMRPPQPLSQPVLVSRQPTQPQTTLAGRRPSRPQATSVSHRPNRPSLPKPAGDPAYVLVVDQSNSTGMTFRAALGRSMSRIQAIQQAARGYLGQLAASNHRQLVALVGFSDQAHLYHSLAPVGRAMPSLSQALWSLHPQNMTNLSDGLSVALGQLRVAGRGRGNIVIITDGAANVQTERLPGLIHQARAAGVRIFTIGVGNNCDGDYDRALLIKMAQSTGGRFMSAHSFKALCSALRQAC